ncbi:MAG: colicin V production protein [Acidobacteria bacterium 13_1_20CM_3_53_8]|nr:MAG: colicin V production protein [Acidobacteria bacterium 13_1_20CM_3_53_8]
MSWNFIDLLLVLLVLLSVLQGWYRGFILGLLDLVRWVGSLLIGLRYYQWLARVLEPHVGLKQYWVLPLAFILVVSFASILIHLVGYLLLRRIPKRVHERSTNRILGILPGFVNGIIAAAIAAPILLALPLPDSLRGPARESVVANHLAVVSETLDAKLSPIFNEAVRQTLNMLTVPSEPESNETVQLPYKVTNTKPRPDLEIEMLQLVNRERAAAGLAPLAPDPQLTEVGREHSADMFARGYFSHYTPEGKSPFDRMQQAGVTFRAAGENLALAPTLQIAHTGLMNSPGHRANILQRQFGRVGIGIMDGGVRGIMISQEFRN